MTVPPTQEVSTSAFEPVNWRGLGVLIAKEIERFLNVYAQSIVAPVVTTLLFFMVFAFALGGGTKESVGAVSYLAFLAPGLVIISMAQNAFVNSSISLVVSKVQGNIVDVLMAPLSPLELTVGYAAGGVARGIAVGAASVLGLSLFMDMGVHNFFFIAYHGLMGSLMLALIGIICGVWSERFDHMASVQSFVVMPATFLSGTFYTLDRLPENWRLVCHFNPFFYMIDGFRYGFIGVSDGTLAVGLFVMLFVNIVLLWCVHHLIASGYKLKV